ncbi:IclR family transcriptional regulator domain-containing protein [Xanthobacter tagetidis]|uniref:IclR family transcriptional regulator domain-containing protein n=1 Tax=Xanthobacter tagetidis TaxID=60216 RepID=UPI0016162D20
MKRKLGPATPAILNALAILESFDVETPALSLSEISRRLGIAKASAFRNLNALEQGGYVVKDVRDGSYSLGSKVLDLARRFSEKDRFLSIGGAHLRELSRVTGETSHLAIMDGREIVYVDVAEGSHRVRAVVSRGDRVPGHCVASGKAILAFSDRQRVTEFLAAGLAAFTPGTITSPDGLLTELDRTSRRGYAVNLGEWAEDVSAVAVPVFGPNDAAVGAIGIAGPRLRLGAKMLAHLSEAIKAQARRLSMELGASPGRLAEPSDLSNAAIRRKRGAVAA